MINTSGIPQFVPIHNMNDLREELAQVHDNSLSDTQLLISVIRAMNHMGLIIGEVADNWASVEEWIKTNGVDDTVTAIMNRWSTDGTLAKILDQTALSKINSRIDDFHKELNTAISQINGSNTTMWNNVKSLINDKLSGGAIADTFSNVDGLKNKYPNGADGVFLVSDSKHLFYWDTTNRTWTDAGSYASNEPNDDSIDVAKLKANAQTTIFTPSRDGIPNYNTTTNVLDFNCVNDNAYFAVSNKIIRIPTNQTVTNTLSDLTSAKLIYDKENNSFSFVAWNTPISSNQTLLGTLRHGYINTTNAYYWTGTFDIAIDGRQQNQRDIPAHTIFSIGSGKKPNFDTTTREFDFGSTTTTTPTIQMGTKVIGIPNGTIAKPTERAMNVNTMRVVYNVYENTAQVVAWDELLPPNTIVVCLVVYNFYRGFPYISGGFPYLVNGEDPNYQRDNIDVVPSLDGLPYYDVESKILDFNCYTDSAYIIYNGAKYQIPRNTRVNAGQFTSTKFSVKLSTMEFFAHAWSDTIPAGEVVLLSIRTGTHNNETLTSGSIPLQVRGQSQKSYATDNPVNAKIKGINHRGFNSVAPEESKSAYMFSKQNGYHHWEGDINWTRDNIPVMIHDKAINRTARDLNGKELPATVNITDITYAETDNYDFGIVKGERFAKEPLLKFEDLVRLARYNNAFLHIEFKYEFTQAQVEILDNIIKKYHMEDRIGWQAFGWEWLRPMIALEPNADYEMLGGVVNDDYFTRLATFKNTTNRVIASQNSGLSVADIQKISDKGYPIYLWTVDDGDTVRKFRDVGMVEGFMTNGAINVTDELTKGF